MAYRADSKGRHLLTVAAVASLSACIGGTTRGFALYSGQARDTNSIAMLLGDIATVDGRDVAGEGRTFELLPGCHIVTTRTSFGRLEQGWSVSGTLPKLTFAINMQANRSYVIEYDMVHHTGDGGTLELDAHEQDASGAAVATLLPTEDPEVLKGCQLASHAVPQNKAN